MPRKAKDVHYYEAVGRRKEAIARVRLHITGKEKSVSIVSGSKERVQIKQGEMYVNGRPIEKMFSTPYEKSRYLSPFKLTDSEGRFAVSILVRGGGKHGQLEAVILGIARALSLADKEQYRPTLKKQHLLTRDARTRERRKVGTGGKARRAKQSPKR